MSAPAAPSQVAGGARAARPPTVALALSGGGARGLAHIHVIEALDELGIRPVAIAGSSIGAILGAAAAAGMSGAAIGDFARGVLSRRGAMVGRMWRARPETLSEMVAGGLRLTQFNVERILRAFLPEAIPATFAELAVPLQVVATDYYGHRAVAFDEGDLVSALAASAAIPAVFSPVMRDGCVYIDGGIYNPLPFDLLQGKADIVIAVDVVGGPEENSPRGPTSIDLMFGATQLMMQAIIAHKAERRPPEIVLRPRVSRFRVLDFLKIDQVMAETAAVKDEAKRAVAAAVAAHGDAAEAAVDVAEAVSRP